MTEILQTIPASSPDVYLGLTDSEQTIIVLAHRRILEAKSDFLKLVLSPHDRTSILKISTQVPNADAAFDIMATEFYDKAKSNRGTMGESKHLLEKFRCRDHWGLPNDDSFMAHTKVDPLDYPLLLQAVQQIKRSDYHIRCCIRNMPHDFNMDDLESGLREEINQLILDPGYNIAFTCIDNTVRVWNYGKKQIVKRGPISKAGYGIHGEHIFASGDGSLLATISTIGYVKMWDLRKKLDLSTSFPPKTCVISFSHNSQFVALAGSYLGIYLYDRSFRVKKIDADVTVSRLAWSPHDDILAYADNDGRISLYNLTALTLDYLFAVGRYIKALQYSPSGSILVAVSSNNAGLTGHCTLNIWCTTEYSMRIIQLKTMLTSVCFSPDSQWIVTGTWPNHVKIWDVASGVCIKKIRAHYWLHFLRNNCFVTDLFFSPDGKQLIVNYSHAITIYQLQIVPQKSNWWNLRTCSHKILGTLRRHLMKTSNISIKNKQDLTAADRFNRITSACLLMDVAAESD